MADGPDINAQLLQMQSMIAAANGNGKGSPLLNGLGLRDADVFAGLSPKGKGLNSDGMMNKLPQGKPGLFAKILADAGFTSQNLNEGAAKARQGAQAMYSGDVPTGMPVSSNAPRGGGGGPELA